MWCVEALLGAALLRVAGRALHAADSALQSVIDSDSERAPFGVRDVTAQPVFWLVFRKEVDALMTLSCSCLHAAVGRQQTSSSATSQQPRRGRVM